MEYNIGDVLVNDSMAYYRKVLGRLTTGEYIVTKPSEVRSAVAGMSLPRWSLADLYIRDERVLHEVNGYKPVDSEVELTMDEIADKFGINVDNLKIKKQ